ncbi:MAG: hypothetical protein D6725_07805 [Planctomycetota bacterium]|nr:MAG: hypothetical protein D6725_07805 [Planctomycetota bacterium]
MPRTSSSLTRLIAVLYWTAAWAVTLPHTHHAEPFASFRSDAARGQGAFERSRGWSSRPLRLCPAERLRATVANGPSSTRFAPTGPKDADARRSPTVPGVPLRELQPSTDADAAAARVGGSCWCQAVVKRAASGRTCRARLSTEPLAFVILPRVAVSYLPALRCLLPRAPPFCAA